MTAAHWPWRGIEDPGASRNTLSASRFLFVRPAHPCVANTHSRAFHFNSLSPSCVSESLRLGLEKAPPPSTNVPSARNKPPWDIGALILFCNAFRMWLFQNDGDANQSGLTMSEGLAPSISLPVTHAASTSCLPHTHALVVVTMAPDDPPSPIGHCLFCLGLFISASPRRNLSSPNPLARTMLVPA